jgi:hypothetical protein
MKKAWEKREIPRMGVHSFFYKINIINKFASQTTRFDSLTLAVTTARKSRVTDCLLIQSVRIRFH